MKIYRSKNVTGAYKKILRDLLYEPEHISRPRGMQIKEILNCTIEVENPMENLFENEFRSSPKKYIAAELLWYFSGTKSAVFIEQYAKLWSTLKDEQGNVNSAYGNLIFTEKNEHSLTQYAWAIETLKRDKDSRQAFMHFNKPKHQHFDNKDQVCTLQSLFHIRDNKLNMTLTMRSNDVIFGFMTDFAFFSVLQYQVYLHLKDTYPDLEMGSYTHVSHSMHLYERHYELVEKMLSSKFISKSLPLMNSSIINEDGSWQYKYDNLFKTLLSEAKVANELVGNDLLDYSINLLT